MRLIIGYNNRKNTIIYSDTWGLGHEKKSARMDAASRATSGLFRFEPKMK